MKQRVKKLLVKLLVFISICIVIYFVFIGYLVTNGFKDYIDFCSKYTNQIDKYKAQNGRYPDSLSELNTPNYSFRYSSKECSYYSRKNVYSFTVTSGLIGSAFYESKTKKWTYD